MAVAFIVFGLLGGVFRALEAEMNVPFVTGQAVQGMIVIAMLVGTRLGRGWKETARL